jgi:hypothetical protein
MNFLFEKPSYICMKTDITTMISTLFLEAQLLLSLNLSPKILNQYKMCTYIFQSYEKSVS